MGYSASVSVEVECDRCSHMDYFDLDEEANTEDIEDYLEAEGWQFVMGDLLCPDCVEKYGPQNVFLEKCNLCTRHINVQEGFDRFLHCPHYKMRCSDVFDNLYEDSDDGSPTCAFYLPVGGIKEEGPKYAPTTASLEGFVEGLKKEVKG